ncbi:MAG: HU family DNA-binding protein [Deltaproteobacteria bacterium]|nr:HU family DNA-binding protein [Deltaproteobacteria bacterium]
MTFIGQKELLERVARLSSELSPILAMTAAENILLTVAEGLGQGREVCIRGFGRFMPRHYAQAKNKKLGVVFHASPRLLGQAETSASDDPQSQD